MPASRRATAETLGPRTNATAVAAMSEKVVAAATPAEDERSLWVVGSSRQAFAAASPILRRVKDRFPRMRLVYTPRDLAVADWLRDHHPECLVVARPSTSAPLCRSAILQRNPRLMLLLDGVSALRSGVVAGGATPPDPDCPVGNGRHPAVLSGARVARSCRTVRGVGRQPGRSRIVRHPGVARRRHRWSRRDRGRRRGRPDLVAPPRSQGAAPRAAPPAASLRAAGGCKRRPAVGSPARRPPR